MSKEELITALKTYKEVVCSESVLRPIFDFDLSVKTLTDFCFPLGCNLIWQGDKVTFVKLPHGVK